MPVPSVEALREIVNALHAFMALCHSESNYCQRQERHTLRPFLHLADALASVRPLNGKLVGWNPRVARALADADEAFRDVAREWGWERLIEPGKGRKGFLKERRERFREVFDRPRYEAAIAWQEGSVRLTDCTWQADAIAETGRALGYAATNGAAEAPARFDAANVARFQAPRLGSSYPRFTPEAISALSLPYHALLPLVTEAERRAEILAVSPSKPHADGVPREAATAANEAPPAHSTTSAPPPDFDRPAEVPDYVTLDQAAAIVSRHKRSLERYVSRKKDPFPAPAAEGGGGRPHLYDWRMVRPWLEREFNRVLPETFPRKRS